MSVPSWLLLSKDLKQMSPQRGSRQHDRRQGGGSQEPREHEGVEMARSLSGRSIRLDNCQKAELCSGRQ